MAALADVIELPRRQVSNVVDIATEAASTATAAAGSITALLLVGGGSVDDWGRDPAFVSVINDISRMRWDIAAGGADHLPPRRGALVVTNAQRFALTPILTALALTRALDRTVRFVGRPDTAPLGPALRRLGGLLERPDEVEGALRDGDLVVLGATATVRPRDVGKIDHQLVGAAVAAKVDVFPAATSSTPLGRQVRIEIGPRVTVPRKRRGPLAELELADIARHDVAQLLGEMGDITTGTPLDWLPFSGMGSH